MSECAEPTVRMSCCRGDVADVAANHCSGSGSINNATTRPMGIELDRHIRMCFESINCPWHDAAGHMVSGIGMELSNRLLKRELLLLLLGQYAKGT